MKAIVIPLRDDLALHESFEALNAAELDGSLEFVLRNAKESKTLQQLGALFGLWFDEIESHTGEDSETLHRFCKARFLSRIYVEEPHGNVQEQWVELLAYYQENGEHEKLLAHAKRISLSWATIKQMRKYMDKIFAYYVNNGVALSVPDKYHKFYKHQTNRK